MKIVKELVSFTLIEIKTNELKEFISHYGSDVELPNFYASFSDYRMKEFDEDVLEDMKEDEYLFMIIRYSTGLLIEEISNCGFLDLLGDDFSFVKYFGYGNGIDGLMRYYGESQIVVRMIYSSSWTDCGYEYDMEAEIIGYLDGDKQLVKL